MTSSTKPFRAFTLAVAICVLGGMTARTTFADAPPEPELELLVEDGFNEPSEQWQMLDPDCWQWTTANNRTFLSLYVKQPSYEPPYRSPHHIALLDSPAVEDFELTVSVRSTEADYGHRDACLVFGFVDAKHFYYVHLGKKTDPHCNQVFIVNGADRTKITETTTEGTPWDDQWRRVKVLRDAKSGAIEIYFDDFEQPVMTATDTTFPAGKVGLGSFDDTADWDDFALRGRAAELTGADSDAAQE